MISQSLSSSGNPAAVYLAMKDDQELQFFFLAFSLFHMNIVYNANQEHAHALFGR